MKPGPHYERHLHASIRAARCALLGALCVVVGAYALLAAFAAVAFSL